MLTSWLAISHERANRQAFLFIHGLPRLNDSQLLSKYTKIDVLTGSRSLTDGDQATT